MLGFRVEHPGHFRIHEGWRAAGVPGLVPGARFSWVTLTEVPALSILGALSGSHGFCEPLDSLVRNAFST